MKITGIRSRKSFAGAVSVSLVLAGGLVSLTPGVASAAPSGGPTLVAKCNQYTNLPEGGDWTDTFDGLVGNSSAGYSVHIKYTDAAGPESSYDDGYWFADPDGSYHHTYPDTFHVPPSGTAYTWSLIEFAGGVEYDDIITGSGGVTGPNCPGKPQKPNKAQVSPTTIRVTKKGNFTVELGGDNDTTGSVTVWHGSDQLASHGYAIHKTGAATIKMKLGKGDLKHLKKVRSETVKYKSTAQNLAGLVKNTDGGLLEAPKKKK